MTVPVMRCSVAPVRNGRPDARLLVLGPSLGTTSEMWGAAADLLAENYRLLRFDLPGHGFSPATSEPFSIAELAEGVLALVDSVGGGAFHYAGVSTAGQIGIELALAHPERLLSLAVFCSGSKIGSAEGWHARASQVRASGTASVVGTSASRWFAPGFLERDPGPGAAALDRLLQIDDESYALVCDALAVYDSTAQLGSISVATVAVAGEFDVATPPDQLRQLAEGIPGAQFRLVADAGHLAVIERPAAAVDILLDQFGEPGRSESRADAYRAGMAVRRAVLGDDHVDAALARTTPETADFQDFITRYAWGEIWTRPGLDRRSRSLLTIASLVAGGHENEIAMHIRAALTNGLGREEISEAILHVAIYAGVPAANSAFAIAQEVFAAIDREASHG